MAKKKKKEEEVKKYIEKVIKEIISITPLIRVYQIKYLKAKENEDGGEFSILYNPSEFYAEFLIYSKVFKLTAEGLTEGAKNFIKLGLAHEVGHCYLWELEGVKRDIEKIASQIGFLIVEIMDEIEKGRNLENSLKSMAKKCPGGKIRSKGAGRGLGYGKRRGPIGVPYRRKRKRRK